MRGTRRERAAARPVAHGFDTEELLPIVRRVVFDDVRGVGIPHDRLRVAARDDGNRASEPRIDERELVLRRGRQVEDVIDFVICLEIALLRSLRFAGKAIEEREPSRPRTVTGLRSRTRK